jgi:ATP-binding protein involved in chromosome partitioning
MPSKEDIEGALRGVIDPELGVDIVELGMVDSIVIDDGNITIRIALTIAACPMRDQIETDVVRRVSSSPGVESVTIEVTAMTQAQRTELMEKARLRARENAVSTMVSPTTRVIAISSGKGGVGKSSLTANLAIALDGLGHRVGLLDADIWGFSLPRILGVLDSRLEAGEDRKIEPTVAYGIELVSTGLIIEDEQTALMWRGLMLSKALEQFLRDVRWSRDLDYLLVDMPPGTGDIQMALGRLLPQAEMIVVTTPQMAAQKVAARVADMARRSFMPVLGVIENMSGFTTEDGRHYKLFGEGGGQELADEIGVPLLAQVPLDPYLVEGGDTGRPVAKFHPEGPAGSAIRNAAQRLVETIPPAEDDSCGTRMDVIAQRLADMESARS